MVIVFLILLSGAAVRLTGSGLGCSDWPNCSVGHLTPALSYHPLIEFGNRMVTIFMVVILSVTFLAFTRRRPFRRDLTWLSGLLVLGVFGEAAIGGAVVYSKLNPYLVMVHFLLTLALLVIAVIMVYRGSRDFTPTTARSLVPTSMRRLIYAELTLAAFVVAAGSATTGAAPDTGGASGQIVAKRIPIALRDMAELHSSLALLLVGIALALAVALHVLGVPERLAKAARIVFLVLCAQGAIGYIQYFTHLPGWLVEIHEAGMASLVIGFTQFYLALTERPKEVVEMGEQSATSIPLKV